MGLEEIATEDMEINFDNTTPGIPPLVYTGDLGTDGTTIIVNPSVKTKIDGVALCRVNVVAVFTAATPCPHTFSAHTFVTGAGAIVAPTTYTKDGSLNVLRKGDAGACVGSWTNNSSGAAVPCACDMSIAVAGQGGFVHGD